jgi:hypothetical protein
MPVEDVIIRAKQHRMRRRVDHGPEWPLERKEDSQCEQCRCSVKCPDKPVFSLFLLNLPW